MGSSRYIVKNGAHLQIEILLYYIDLCSFFFYESNGVCFEILLSSSFRDRNCFRCHQNVKSDVLTRVKLSSAASL